MASQATLSEHAPVPAPTGSECRVRERHACDLRTSCQPIAARADKDFMWSATVRDLSVSGIGLVLARRFEPGAGLVIEVPGTESREPESILARVVHATSLSRGLWLLGCTFPSPLSEDELHGLLRLARSQKEQVNTSESTVERLTARPVQERLTPSPKAGEAARDFLIPRVMFETKTDRGVALRLLVRALRLTGAWPLTKGTELKIWLGPRGANDTATKVVVDHCTQADEQWTVHYSFADRPSADLLRSFGHP